MEIFHSIVAAGAYTSDPKAHHIAEMVQLGFSLCLRYCEYTNCIDHCQTVNFRPLLDFMFFIRDSLIPMDSPIEHFHQATKIFLTLENQKNYI